LNQSCTLRLLTCHLPLATCLAISPADDASDQEDGRVKTDEQLQDDVHGVLDSWWQVADTESVVGNLEGVRDVVSELRVVPPEVDAETLKRDIERALERRADKLMRRVQMSIEGDTVTLSGVVHSAAERDAVLSAARCTRGVQAVQAHLRVEHPEYSTTAAQHLHAQVPL
jgi:osmotically-inducible protein OsmY